MASDTSKQRIVHLSTVHPRRDTRILRREAVSLHEVGYDVHFVVADGLGEEALLGIPVHDVGKVSGRPRRMLQLPIRAYSKTREIQPALVHLHDPELLPIGVLLRRRGYKVVYDAHEDLPRAILSKHWLAPAVRNLVSRVSETVENFCARRMSAVVTATPHIARRFQRIQPETVCVTNYPVISGNGSPPQRTPEPCTFVYAGAISRKRGINEMIEAARLAGAKLLLAGPMEDQALLGDVSSRPGWENVEYLGVVDHSEVWKLMARSMAGLLFFHPEPNHVHSVPNKMFEYMAGGLPILCSDFPDWAEIVTGCGIGLSADPLDAQAIAALMRRIMDDPTAAEAMGRHGREELVARYRWENEARKLVELYGRLLGSASANGDGSTTAGGPARQP